MTETIEPRTYRGYIIDKLGHCTRYSDSSVYDEVCIFCGGTDAPGNRSLYKPCPKTPPEETYYGA